VTGRDVTESIPLNIGQPALPNNVWYNQTTAYDIAIGGLPFIFAKDTDRPYQRQTAPYRKQQFDNSKEPGEQSLQGWWIRSQSSFHRGAGIKYYDPSAGEEILYRFADSQGVNVWTPGQVTLLNSVVAGHNITNANANDGLPKQHMRSIHVSYVITNKVLTSNVATLTTSVAHSLIAGTTVEVVGVDSTFNGTYVITNIGSTTTFSYAKTATNVSSTAVSPNGSASADFIMLHDGHDVDLINAEGNPCHFIDYINGTDEPVYAICDDGKTAYWVTNKINAGSLKKHLYKKNLNAGLTVSDTLLFNDTGNVTNSCIEWVKERIILTLDNKVYELTSSTSSLPAPLYTHPNDGYIFTSIIEHGSSIYLSGYLGGQSSIFRFALETDAGLPTLAFGSVSAEMPTGEIIYSMYDYLGYIFIGTNRGVRVASIDYYSQSMTYGPLIVQTTDPVYSFTSRDKYVWATIKTNSGAGLVRFDLSQQIYPLVFAYAPDLQVDDVNRTATACAFLGSTSRLAFCTPYTTSNGNIYIESETVLRSSGYISTGRIRFDTLEYKNFKRISTRADVTSGSIEATIIDQDGTEYSVFTYDIDTGTPEITTSVISGNREYVSYKFVLNRDTNTSSLGPIFRGYQSKALPAAPRQRMIQFPVYCFDLETDRYSNIVGYENRARERIVALENLEATGDEVTFQDFTSGEQGQCVIEQVTFSSTAPPSRGFSGYGGIVEVVIRKL